MKGHDDLRNSWVCIGQSAKVLPVYSDIHKRTEMVTRCMEVFCFLSRFYIVHRLVCALFSVWCGVQLNCVLISTCTGGRWWVQEGFFVQTFVSFDRVICDVALPLFCFSIMLLACGFSFSQFLLNITLIVFCCERGRRGRRQSFEECSLQNPSPATQQTLACMWEFFFPLFSYPLCCVFLFFY